MNELGAAFLQKEQQLLKEGRFRKSHRRGYGAGLSKLSFGLFAEFLLLALYLAEFLGRSFPVGTVSFLL